MAIYIGDPAGLSWQDARAKVRGDLWRPGNSLSDDVVNRALHASVLDLEGETKWLWLEQLTALATFEETSETMDLPATIGRVSSVAVRRDGVPDPLDQKPLQTVRAGVGTDIGDPSAWALGDLRLWFDSRCAAGTELELIVTIATPRRLEHALQSPSYTLEVEQQAVIARACAYIALNFMKNAEEAARQRAVYDSIVERLLGLEAEQRGGMIQPDTWGTGYHG